MYKCTYTATYIHLNSYLILKTEVQKKIKLLLEKVQKFNRKG